MNSNLDLTNIDLTNIDLYGKSMLDLNLKIKTGQPFILLDSEYISLNNEKNNKYFLLSVGYPRMLDQITITDNLRKKVQKRKEKEENYEVELNFLLSLTHKRIYRVLRTIPNLIAKNYYEWGGENLYILIKTNIDDLFLRIEETIPERFKDEIYISVESVNKNRNPYKYGYSSIEEYMESPNFFI